MQYPLPAPRFISCFAAAILLLPALVSAQPGVPGSPIHGEVVAGYYPVSDVYRYAADVNVWFDYGSHKATKFYFRGGILTLIKASPEKDFQPDRYRGTLEPGARWVHGDHECDFFIKHHSYHDIDRFDGINESYEVYGLRYTKATTWNPTIAAGKYCNTQDLDYDWDFFASVDNGCIGVCNRKPLYAAASLHLVTEKGDVPGRKDFLDYSAEVGIETHAQVRYFVSYRQVHDIDRYAGTTDHGLLAGVRYTW